MQQPASGEPLPTSTNFAEMLASLASPPVENPEPPGVWGESELGEDVVTLSYERALRASARHRPADSSFLQPDTAMRLDEQRVRPASQAQQKPFDRDLRTASVTVRFSQGECASLHRRAAEAGLTVSGYLRSCTIEAEALRTQVKEALAGLRLASQSGEAPDAAAPSHPRRGEEVRLSRVLGRIGKLCLGISTSKRA